VDVELGAAIGVEETLLLAERCEVRVKCRQSMLFCLVAT
jgi:hypothetical protein